jgi:hypothetical protein
MANQDVIIPSSPEDREKIRRVLRTVSDSMTRIEAEKDLIKDEIGALVEDFEIPRKFLNKMARTFHRQNFKDIVDEQDDFATLYETVVELNQP